MKTQVPEERRGMETGLGTGSRHYAASTGILNLDLGPRPGVLASVESGDIAESLFKDRRRKGRRGSWHWAHCMEPRASSIIQFCLGKQQSLSSDCDFW